MSHHINNAGRPRKIRARKTYCLVLAADELRSVKRVARKCDMSAADFIRRAIAEQLVELRSAA